MVRAFPILMCLTIGMLGLGGSLSAAAPSDESAVAAVFPPWWTASRSLSAASQAGAVLDAGVLPFVLIVRSPHPGLSARLRAAGALILLNPLGLGGCVQSGAGNQDV